MGGERAGRRRGEGGDSGVELGIWGLWFCSVIQKDFCANLMTNNLPLKIKVS